MVWLLTMAKLRTPSRRCGLSRQATNQDVAWCCCCMLHRTSAALARHIVTAAAVIVFTLQHTAQTVPLAVALPHFLPLLLMASPPAEHTHLMGACSKRAAGRSCGKAACRHCRCSC